MKEQIEKQAIEEMAEIIAQHTYEDCERIPFNNMRMIVDNVCEANVPSCGSCKAARALTKAGYRKQSEGEWEQRTDVVGFVRCSVCKDCNVYDEWVDGKKWNYCPHCGAKMKGATDERE